MEPSPIHIVLVEDNDGDARLLREILGESTRLEFRVERVRSLAQALPLLINPGADVVLLDLMLPDSFGIETIQRVSATAPDVPIVVLTGLSDEEFGVEAMRHGAQDYLIKGHIDFPLLSRTIRYAVERQRLLTELNSLALTDPLTGLHNRRSFMALATQELKLAQRTLRPLMLLYIDMDALKAINDHYGHTEGDRAIRMTAEILKTTFRNSDIVARVGGDEFLVLTLEVIPDCECESAMIPRLLENLRRQNATGALPYTLSFTIGTACFSPDAPIPLAELIAAADRSLYAGKRRIYDGTPPDA